MQCADSFFIELRCGTLGSQDPFQVSLISIFLWLFDRWNVGVAVWGLLLCRGGSFFVADASTPAQSKAASMNHSVADFKSAQLTWQAEHDAATSRSKRGAQGHN